MTYILVLVIVGLLVYTYLQRKDFNNLADEVIQEAEEAQSKALEYEIKAIELSERVANLTQTIEVLKDSKVDLGSMIDRESYSTLYNNYESLTQNFLTLKQKYDTMVSNSKSKEVRLGAIAETLTPFLQGFPYDPKALRPLGNPIDYIAFEEEEVVFIEVKSGNASLTSKQRKIKDLIETGKVRFEVHRINEDGLTIK
jgi:predicted Holliday junction resolvase-like endonuclease